MEGVTVTSSQRLRIMDACVLIDFCLEDSALLGLAVQKLGPIVVLTPVLAEVRQLDEVFCGELGLQILEPNMVQVQEATVRRGGLSFRDRLCLAVARAEQGILFSNDKRLLNEAVAGGVDGRWGLEILLELVVEEALTPEAALQSAEGICHRSIYPAEPLLAEFRRRLGG